VTRLSDWLAAFRALHEKARRRQLNPAEAQTYRLGRDELARALLAAQRLTLKSGQTARKALRVARALQIEVVLPTARERAITLDLSTGGFSTMLTKAPPLGDEVGYSIRLPADEPLVGRARITDLKPQADHVRVAGQFLDLAPDDLERLELYIFDAVLAQLAG
jgi:PilZ domain